MLNEMRLSTEVVRANGLAAASRKLVLVPSSVLRHVDALEEALVVRPLNRSMRKLSLLKSVSSTTTKQPAFCPSSKTATLPSRSLKARHAALEHARGARAIAHHFGGERISEPVSRGKKGSDGDGQVLDLVEVGIDVAARVGALQNSSLVARELASNCYMLCGSQLI